MSLRRTLLLAFVLLGLLPAAALAWLGFTRTRDAMTAQIRQNLSVQARGLQSDIDRMLFERFENAIVWSRSELMQDLRVGDVDKRVASYLVGLQAGYGDVYQGMDCIGPDGRIVASSIGTRIGLAGAFPDPARRSVRASLAGAVVSLALPATERLDDTAPFAISTVIPSIYALPGTPDARLNLAFDARQVSRLLDAAAVDRRVIVVIDAQGRWVAGSGNLRGRPLPDAAARAAGVALAHRVPDGATQDAPWLAAPALWGRGDSVATARFGGSGWTTLVFEPVDEALAPVTRMAAIFGGLLAAVLVAVLLAANWIAAAISRPIAALTETTRAWQRGVRPEAAPARSRIAELDVLAQAYDDMVHAVEHSRRELVRTSKMAMLGELAAVLAHEVRTPLGILRSSAQILKRDTGLRPDSLELMAFIESETERLNRLVSTLLDTARPRTPDLAPCDVHALLRRCAQMHDLRRGDDGAAQPVQLRLDALDPVVPADAEQLMQVVFNLLNNATQAAGPRGRVLLATADAPGALAITCEDDGPGVTPELAERLFDPFVSGRAGGIGLGLAVVRQVVQAHRGEVAAGRAEAGGAAFVVRLPRAQSASKEP